jgi:tetratricopeptide (TPR) repeat protein
MRPSSLLFALIVAIAAPGAFAQSPDTTDPREFSEEARKAYAQSLKDARALIADKRYTDAIATLDKLTAERPREPQARFLKGVALTDAGKTDEAIAAFQGVLNEYPELPEPRNNLAVLYAQKGDYAMARDELEAAIGAAPDYVIAYENLGDIYARLAMVNYEKAIARDARNRSAPVKLKLVRDALAPPAVTPAAQVAPATAPAVSTASPAAAPTVPAAPATAPSLPAAPAAPAAAPR